MWETSRIYNAIDNYINKVDIIDISAIFLKAEKGYSFGTEVNSGQAITIGNGGDIDFCGNTEDNYITFNTDFICAYKESQLIKVTITYSFRVQRFRVSF